MILMSDTGGGHRASAEALESGFEKLYGDDYQVSAPVFNLCRAFVFSKPHLTR
jgi:hypothetical protein